MLLSDQKHLFNLPKDIVYLNCANLSPLLNSVSSAGMQAIERRTNPWSIQSRDWFNPAEKLRDLFAGIISTQKENIALVPAVSYGMAIAAKNLALHADENIVVLHQQYPSNVYIWRELARESGAGIISVQRRSGQTWTEALLGSINEDTGIVAIPNCHWTDGSMIDLDQVSLKTKEMGASLVIDASQSLGAYPLDVNKIRPDFLVTVGYKWLMGPYHLAYLYADPKHLNDGIPIEHSWLSRFGSEDFSRLVDYTDRFRPGARRFDGGEFPGFLQTPMAIAALSQIVEWGVDNIQQTLSELTQMIEVMANQKGYRTEEKHSRSGHMIAIELTNQKNMKNIKRKLIDRNIYVSIRGSKMRVAPHLYNDPSDIERLFECL